ARTARPVAESTSFELSVPSPAKRSVAGGRDTGWGHVVASGCHRPYVVPRAGVRRALTCRRASARALCARPPPLAQGGVRRARRPNHTSLQDTHRSNRAPPAGNTRRSNDASGTHIRTYICVYVSGARPVTFPRVRFSVKGFPKMSAGS